MKTKEEIEQLAEKSNAERGIDSAKSMLEREYVLGYTTAYTQCQEDMVEKYTEQDMIKFAFDNYYQEDMAKKYTKEDIIKAIAYGQTTKQIDYHKDFINSLNKQD